MNILLTGAVNYSSDQLVQLKNIGLKLYFLPFEWQSLDNETDIPLNQIDAIVGNQIFQYTDLSAFPNLKFIQATSSGLDRMPLVDIKRRGIVLKNAAGIYSQPIAEFVLAVILDHYKGLAKFHMQQLNHQWIKNRDLDDLGGKRALIVGTGQIGSAIAKRLQAFDVQTIGLYHQNVPGQYFDNVWPITTLDQQLASANIVILAIPQTPDTLKIINSSRIAMMKNDSLLINVARGMLVDQTALITSQRHAILDVFENEPLPVDDLIWRQPNIFITPHNAFVSQKNQARFFALLLENLKKFQTSQ